MVTAGTMEGGDFNVIEDGVLLMGCGGARTQDEGAQQIKRWIEKEGWKCAWPISMNTMCISI